MRTLAAENRKSVANLTGGPAPGWYPSRKVGIRPARLRRLVVSLSGNLRQETFFFQAVQGQAIASVDTGLLENVLQVNLDGARPDAELGGNIFVLHALLNQLEDFLFAGSQVVP